MPCAERERERERERARAREREAHAVGHAVGRLVRVASHDHRVCGRDGTRVIEFTNGLKETVSPNGNKVRTFK
jgi:hypothetical protein